MNFLSFLVFLFLMTKIRTKKDFRVFPLKLQNFVIIPKILELPNHAYLIESVDGDGSFVMVDCGQASDYEVIRDAFLRLDIKHIIISHAHPDHLGCLKQLKEEFRDGSWRFISHREEAEDVKLGRQASSKPFGILPSILMTPLFWLTDHVFGDSVITDPSIAVTPDILFSEDDFDESIEQELLNKFGVRVLHTVGHTPGSLSVFVEDTREVIIGDMLTVKLFKSDFGYHSLVLDEKELHKSFEKIFSLNPDRIYGPHLHNATTVDEVIKNLGLNTETDEM